MLDVYKCGRLCDYSHQLYAAIVNAVYAMEVSKSDDIGARQELHMYGLRFAPDALATTEYRESINTRFVAESVPATVRDIYVRHSDILCLVISPADPLLYLIGS